MLARTGPGSAPSSSPPPVQGISGCSHEPEYVLVHQDTNLPQFCGLCRLIELWEDEVPRRIHAYKLLAENGNPEVAPQFFSHYLASLGLIPPKNGQNLREYRLARGQYIGRAPSKSQYPLLAALWDMMGYQPKLARALLGALRSQPILYIAIDLGCSPVGANQAVAKGIRMAFRSIRSYR